MTELHWNFVAAAYGLTAVLLLIEWLMLRSRRRQAIARVRRERDLDDAPPPYDLP